MVNQTGHSCTTPCVGLHPKQKAAGLIWILDGTFYIPTFPDEISTSDEGDISVHPPEVREVPSLLIALVSKPDTTLDVGKGIAQGLEAGAELITQPQPHLMHRDCYPGALTPGCFFFSFLFVIFLGGI